MELTQDKINENTAVNVDIAIERLYYHMNMNLLAFHADIT